MIAVETTAPQPTDAQRPSFYLLVDLVGSTSYKTRNPQQVWLPRLREFYQAVDQTVGDRGQKKYLGDGVLVCLPFEPGLAGEVVNLARAILTRLSEVPDRPAEHAMTVRITLSYGEATFFEANDPQGTVVDKVFRLEKHVPANCIGATAEFASVFKIKDPPLTQIPLKGLSSESLHGLWLVEPPEPAIGQREMIIDRSYAAALWLPDPDFQQLVVVGGYIPDYGEPGVYLQMGDANAKLRAYETVVSLGCDVGRIAICDSSEFRDQDYRADIISVGGPCYNHVTRKLLDQLPVRFENLETDDDVTPLFDEAHQERLFAERHPVSNRITRDWGLFVSRSNPSDTRRRVTVAAGIESSAVDGIVRAFSPQNVNFRNLIDKVKSLAAGGSRRQLPDFYCIMPFQVEATGKAALPALSDQVARVWPLT